MAMIVETQGRRATGWRQAAVLAATLAIPLAGAGCSAAERMYSSKLPFDQPIDWWHQLQGGTIAEDRPPPPGVTDPYPSLALIPAKPVPTDLKTRTALSERLASQRSRMERDAAEDPLVPFGAKAAATASASASAPGAPAGTAPANVTEAPPMARIEAASAATPAAAAPVPAAPAAPAAIQRAASERPRRAGSSPAAGNSATGPVPNEPVVSGPVPALPVSAPAFPSLPGIPSTVVPPATLALAPASRSRPQAVVSFLPGSAVLRPESDAALRTLASRRFDGAVAVLGGGDAGSAAPDIQAAALPLAWRRAQAIAAVLTEAGIPASALRVDAAALGRGGIARLVD